jgi:hypothetical protein
MRDSRGYQYGETVIWLNLGTGDLLGGPSLLTQQTYTLDKFVGHHRH